MDEPKAPDEFRWTDRIDSFFGSLAYLCSWALGLATFAIIVGQAGWWAYSGEWIPISAADVIAKVAEFIDGEGLANWAIYPSSWIGLHKMLSGFPGSLLMFGLAIMFGGIATSLNFDGFD